MRGHPPLSRRRWTRLRDIQFQPLGEAGDLVSRRFRLWAGLARDGDRWHIPPRHLPGDWWIAVRKRPPRDGPARTNHSRRAALILVLQRERDFSAAANSLPSSASGNNTSSH